MTLGFVGLVIVQTYFFKPKLPDASVENTAKQTKPVDGADKAEGKEVATEPQEPAEVRPDLEREFLTLGSFDPDGNSLVITLDTRGATLRRVELNERNANGEYKYSDVDYRNAWIGQLELEEQEDGLKVGLVIPGTPAAEAGLAAGDVIQRVNEETVMVPAEAVEVSETETEPQAPATRLQRFERTLAGLPPGAPVDLKVRRGEEELMLTSETTLMPMQVVRPTDPELLTDRELKRRGFQFTLKKKQPGEWLDLDAEMRSRNWQSQIKQIDGREVAEFTYDLPKDSEGRKFQAVKRFSLSTDPERPYHIDFETEIRNLGDEKTTVYYELCGPTGTPNEGWWYQQKIHGGTWAIGKAAGARDITMGSEGHPFKFISGPQIVSDKEDPENRGTVLVDPSFATDQRRLKFLGVDTLYFNVALLPKTPDYECFSAFGLTASKLTDNKSERRRLTDVTYVLYSNGIELDPWDEEDPDTAYTESWEIFVGPKEPALLESYGLSDTRTFGWFAAFSKPLITLLHWLYTLTFSWSYGLAIVLLTVIVRICMIPISRKAALNAQMMQYLAPQMKELQEKHKDDPKKFFKARSELCSRHNYKPLGGCLLMFVQLPIFLGLYRGLSVDIELRNAPLIPGLDWATNLGGPDRLFEWANWPFMPAFIGGETGFLGPYFNLLPVIAIVLMFMQQKLFMPPPTDDQSAMAQKMMKFMMIFIGFVFFKVAAGLCVYFITSSIWGIVERKMLPKPELDTSRFDADGNEKNPGNGKPTESLPLRNEQQLEDRKRRDKERKRKLRQR